MSTKLTEHSDEMFLELSTQWADLNVSQNAQFRAFSMRMMERLQREAITDRDAFVARVFAAGLAKVVEGAGEIRAARVEAN